QSDEAVASHQTKVVLIGTAIAEREQLAEHLVEEVVVQEAGSLAEGVRQPGYTHGVGIRQRVYPDDAALIHCTEAFCDLLHRLALKLRMRPGVLRLPEHGEDLRLCGVIGFHVS